MTSPALPSASVLETAKVNPEVGGGEKGAPIAAAAGLKPSKGETAAMPAASPNAPAIVFATQGEEKTTEVADDAYDVCLGMQINPGAHDKRKAPDLSVTEWKDTQGTAMVLHTNANKEDRRVEGTRKKPKLKGTSDADAVPMVTEEMGSNNMEATGSGAAAGCSHGDSKDVLSWAPDRRGVFSVLSAYKLALEDRTRTNACATSRAPDGTRAVWKAVWGCPAPPKQLSGNGNGMASMQLSGNGNGMASMLGEAKLSGTLDVLAGMADLQQAWLHGNQFTGPIPDAISNCKQLVDLKLNNNDLVGLVPPGLTALPLLRDVKLDNNNLVGPAPALKSGNLTSSHNGFCAVKPEDKCAPEVMALLQFQAEAGYPVKLTSSWSGNDPCKGWLGVTCSQGKVSVLNLPSSGLNGTISKSLGDLSALSDIRLDSNHLTGHVPDSLTGLKLLKKLDLGMNDLNGPLPAFRPDVNVILTGNPNFNTKTSPGGSAPKDAPHSPTTPGAPGSQGQGAASPGQRNKKSKILLATTIPVAIGVVALLSLGAVVLFCKKNGSSVQPQATSSVVVHPRNSSGPDNLVKIVMTSNDSFGATSSGTSSRDSDIHMIEARNFVISVQVLRCATKNFAPDNVLGRGGFGVVYKGVLHDGTMIAVKRMESSVISNKALDEFQAEIAILTKVRHRNLVSIMGYVTGKITTKADVFSFGVVLMELITGMTAIDERRIDEETRYLASWFGQIRKDEEKFRAAIDPTLELTDEIFESISVVAELAGHCTSREPSQRPDMGHAVTVLVPMVEKWKPSNNEAEDYMGIDLHLPLLQMVKGWQESEASMTDGSIMSLSLEDSKGSIPARPAGFAESFTSADGRGHPCPFRELWLLRSIAHQVDLVITPG
ncbi:putative receptor protein kinase TMK1 [Triticum urartu]|uniref:Putative receptor protein kinase TMK1 n=1 Tax=Triticum urartu TaxID=4572 RepID=M8A2I9_TRIUA|nr:putative receptor protein kinase TMK1 [Triticum urartu]